MNTMDYKLLDALRDALTFRPTRTKGERDTLVEILRSIRQEAKRHGADEARAEIEIVLKGRYRTAYAEYLKRKRTRQWISRRRGRSVRRQLAA
jgi:SOS-response transcriptional repressor LexA